MTRFSAFAFGSSVLALVAAAPAALADVTAADVWSQWQENAAAQGTTLTADVASTPPAGMAMELRNLTNSARVPDGTWEITLESVMLRENGDGTVSVLLPPSSDATLVVSEDDDDAVTVHATLEQDEFELIASGVPEALAYDYAADSLSLTIDGVEGVPEGSGLTGAFVVNGIAGNQSWGEGAPKPFTSGMTVAGLAFQLDATGVGEEWEGADQRQDVSFTLDIADIAASAEGARPDSMDPNDMGKALRDGFEVSGSLSYGETGFGLSGTGAGDDFTATGGAEGGRYDLALSQAGLSFSSGSQGFNVAVSGDDIPAPQVEVSIARTGFGLTLPMAISEVAQDVKALVRIESLTLDEGIWSMLDPGGSLAHDPLTLILDLSGKGRWLVDILAPDAAEQLEASDMPFEPHAADLNELEVTALGGSLTGTGSFTFDPSDLVTWGGMPAPEGTLELTAKGVSRVLDGLVSLGLLPPEQAMGVQMGMGMFTRPGPEPDSVTTKIEVTRDGHVSANGQQLR